MTDKMMSWFYFWVGFLCASLTIMGLAFLVSSLSPQINSQGEIPQCEAQLIECSNQLQQASETMQNANTIINNSKLND